MHTAQLPLSRGHAGGRRDGHGRPAPTSPGLTFGPLSLLSLALAAVIASPSGGSTQDLPPATGVVTGLVTGRDAGALAGAEVTVAGERLAAVTTREGVFRITGVPLGAVLLEFRFLGFRTASFALEIIAGATHTVDVELEIDPVALDPVEVRARSGLSPEMQGFYDRRERGAGHYFTREEISRMQSREVTDLLRRVPGVRVEPTSGPQGAGYTVRMNRATGIAGARQCPVLYFVNGSPFPLAREHGINNFVRPDEIAGMEVYTGTSRLPSRFHVSPRDARCGVIVIWIRSGERREGR
jgi:hypothetical protein